MGQCHGGSNLHKRHVLLNAELETYFRVLIHDKHILHGVTEWNVTTLALLGIRLWRLVKN